jgi:DNA-directed RNA polymerase subunit M/transcription elongation factor TFIIS
LKESTKKFKIFKEDEFDSVDDDMFYLSIAADAISTDDDSGAVVLVGPFESPEDAVAASGVTDADVVTGDQTPVDLAPEDDEAADVDAMPEDTMEAKQKKETAKLKLKHKKEADAAKTIHEMTCPKCSKGKMMKMETSKKESITVGTMVRIYAPGTDEDGCEATVTAVDGKYYAVKLKGTSDEFDYTADNLEMIESKTHKSEMKMKCSNCGYTMKESALKNRVSLGSIRSSVMKAIQKEAIRMGDVDTSIVDGELVTMNGAGSTDYRALANFINQDVVDAGKQRPEAGVDADRLPSYDGIPGVPMPDGGMKLVSNGGTVKESVLEEGNTFVQAGNYVQINEKASSRKVDSGVVLRSNKGTVTLEGEESYDISNSGGYSVVLLA